MIASLVPEFCLCGYIMWIYPIKIHEHAPNLEGHLWRQEEHGFSRKFPLIKHGLSDNASFVDGPGYQPALLRSIAGG